MAVSEEMKSGAARLAEDGKTPLFIAAGTSLLGVIAVADVVKADSAAAIAALREMGCDVVLLTGDNQRTADAIARQVGVSRVIAQVLPQDKARVVQELQAEGKKVAMVGDRHQRRPGAGDGGCGPGHRRGHRCGHRVGGHRADEEQPYGYRRRGSPVPGHPAEHPSEPVLGVLL